MKLTTDEKFIVLTWIPTVISYLIGDVDGALILLGGNVLMMTIYVYKDKIRSNEKIIEILRKIF